MANERPLDVLERARGKRVLVKIKSGEQFTGILRAADLHINLWLDDAELISEESRKKMGTLLIRGDTVVYVAPE